MIPSLNQSICLIIKIKSSIHKLALIEFCKETTTAAACI